MSLRTSHGFPVTRRPQLRELSNADQSEVDNWFQGSEITIGSEADTLERKILAKRLLYTWRDCFAKTLRDIEPTDLVHHSIDLVDDAKPVYQTIKRYTPKEKEFAARIFPEMEEAGIIMRAASDWGARTQFPPKKKGSDALRVVHNFIPVNKFTIKPQYPMHRIDEVIDTIIKPKYRVFFSTDASNGYWAVPIKAGDEYKTGFVTPHGQYIYRRMGQGLKGACATYSQFGDLVFGPLPKTAQCKAMPTIIGNQGKTAFCLFMDDHIGAGECFQDMFNFLHYEYFPRVAFGPVYLSGHKTYVFTDSLEMVGFTGSAEGLRPSVKHRERAMGWKEPTNREELDAIIWITPFLRMFIPGRAEHVMRLKKAYLKEETIKLESGDSKSIRKKWVEKDSFDWGEEQRQSFQHIKQSISENAMSGIDEDLQIHLATDASKYGIGGVLFQLPGEPPGTPAEEKHKGISRIIMFLSFKLEEVETRYHTTEREALAVVRCLAEVRCNVIGHRFPVMIYSDHKALETVLKVGTDAHGRIARWMDRLTEYDYVIHHRPSKANVIGLADGMSRMPGRYQQSAVAKDEERLAMVASLPRVALPTLIPPTQTHMKYRTSDWYGDVTNYLLDGPSCLKGYGSSKQRAIKRMSYHYRLTDQHLVYLEDDGKPAKCLLPPEVFRILVWAHEEHGHFSVVITLHKLRGEWYWPTRVKDVEKHCRTCHVCQTGGPRKKSTILQPILKFYPFAMLGMDFLGPISPRCQATGWAYILIVIDYFSRFVWTKGCESADQAAVHTFWVEVLAPIFGFPEWLYMDNGSHFIGSETVSLFESHGTHISNAPISHPSSVGLVERNVQLVLAQVRQWCEDKGPEAKFIWGRSLPQIQPNINGRLLRIHGFTPGEILLGYSPKWHVTKPEQERAGAEPIDATAPHANLSYWTSKREEIREGAILSLANYQDRLQAKAKALWTSPKAGDLVMVRDFTKDKAHGRKLDPNWLGPRLLVELTSTGVSGYVRELYGGTLKKYHLDDLKVYCQRQLGLPINCAVQFERGAMRYAGFSGQRAVDLNSPPYMA